MVKIIKEKTKYGQPLSPQEVSLYLRPPTAPTLGNSENINAELKSNYNSDIESTINKVTALYQGGYLKEGTANQLIEDLRSRRIEKPKVSYKDLPLTGDTELDKAIKSKQQGEITTAKNNILEDLALGKITQSEASTRLAELTKKSTGISGSGGRKGRKVALRRVSPVAAKRSKISIKRLKLKKIKLDTDKKRN